MPAHDNAGEELEGHVIRSDEIDRYFYDGKDFINDQLIESLLARAAQPGHRGRPRDHREGASNRDAPARKRPPPS